MKTFLYLILSLFLFPVLNSRGETRPNVILILADDMGLGDISLFNGGNTDTPRLDALIKESAYFEKAYAGSAVCAPSRAALFTGRYPHRTGCVTLNPRKFPEMTRIRLDETTLADRFSENGYTTGLIGKWHSGTGENYHPLKRGFHEFAGFSESWDIKTYFNYRLDVQGEYRDYTDNYLTDDLTDRAIDFVRRHQQKPFFLHLAHYAPHRPLSAPENLINKYTEKGFNEKTATIYAMIEMMDTGIGKLIDELDTLELRENTLIIFSSDNGPDPLPGERYNRNARGAKYTVYEGGIHVPFLMNWKGTIKPERRPEIIQFTDVFPTLMELCHLAPNPPAKPLDGVSFAGLISSQFEASELPHYRFWQWNRATPIYSHNAAIRENQWKLVRPFITPNIPKADSSEASTLYDVDKDPSESQDLATKYPEIRQRLEEKLKQISSEVESSRNRQE